MKITDNSPNSPDQLFYIYDDGGNRLGVMDRETVHREGQWHRGVQLNIFHNGEMLLQQRSNQVDIAKGLFDQALATQLLVQDREDELTALGRGLLTELGIDIESLQLRHVAGPVKIVKRYEYDSDLYNREFVSLYEAHISHRNIQPCSSKVEKVFWLPVDEVKQMARRHPHNFTKTFLMWLEVAM